VPHMLRLSMELTVWPQAESVPACSSACMPSEHDITHKQTAPHAHLLIIARPWVRISTIGPF
jgi:hypothetical protein